MKRKGLLKNVLGLGLILFLGIYFTACEEEKKPEPTLDLFITVNGFTIDIAAEAKNTTSWQWEYGDGTVSDSVGSHTHTYATGGNYTIKCTVTGDGGQTTKTQAVTIATIEDLLTGGASATNGKTWILSRTAGPYDGVGFVKVELVPDYFFAVNDMLDVLELSEEYDNEYTFKFDGSYSLDPINGKVLSGWVYGDMDVDPDDIVKTTAYGIWQINIATPASPKWSLTENSDLTVESVYDADDDQEGGVAETVTFENVDYITYTGDGFIGMKDYTSTVLVREISPERMTLTMFFHSYKGDPANDGGLYLRPSFILTLSFDKK